MSYEYFTLPIQSATSCFLRKQIFERMQSEGLLPYAMHAFHCPTVEQWLELTEPHKGILLTCVPHEKNGQRIVENFCGVALLSPQQGRVWNFDFTTFRAHFSKAPTLSRGAIVWIFNNLPCDSLMGISAVSNRHAWRLAAASGFTEIARLPGACYNARKYKYEDGVLVLAKRPGTENTHPKPARAQAIPLAPQCAQHPPYARNWPPQ